jgi:AraC family transcriptional regulator of adaptative response/methylated-DNA-[protein]-cysteine methyltransferase
VGAGGADWQYGSMTEAETDPLDVLDERAGLYARMAELLERLGDDWQGRVDLTALARQTGQSPFHLQRTFSRWVGLSPARFAGALNHARAGAALRSGASVLEASLEAGLSGPGRLHDLFIAHEALSPGEAKSGAAGIDFAYGSAPTPFGEGAYLVSPRGLSALGFVDGDETAAFDDLKRRYPGASFRRDDAEARRWAGLVFEDRGPVPLALYGTPFRRQVWRALISIPQGQTQTYGGLAAAIGRPTAARATGAAVGANPVSWLIPCHRVLASDARLHQYHWGVARKRAMLVYERAHAEAQGSQVD